MSSVRKFLFDESFDVDLHGHGHGHGHGYGYGHVEEEPEPEPPPPTFGEQELAAARAAGFQEGEAAGRAAGHAQGFAEGHAQGYAEGVQAGTTATLAEETARAAAALDHIAAGVADLIAERDAANAARRDLPVHIALTIVRKLMPEMARRGGLAEIEALVRSCLTDLIDEPRLVVRVADNAVELVRGRLDALLAASGFGTRLVVVPEPALGPGDCRIEWAEGGSERDTRQLLAEIEQCAARLLEAPAPKGTT